jgi:hypothetical protein
MILEWVFKNSLPWNNSLPLIKRSLIKTNFFNKKSLKKIESEFESNELVDM